MRSIFRAKAEGGITPREADRREAAVKAALAGEGALRPLPPPPVVRLVQPAEVPELQLGKLHYPVEPEAPAPAARSEPPIATVDKVEEVRPLVTITIAGLPRSGKSVIAHVIRNALAREGIVSSGPDDLRSIRWHGAVDNLIGRGISVVLVKAEAGPESTSLMEESR